MTLRLVIFDCDGVLVDSEGLSQIVVLREAARLGWALDAGTAHGFMGRRWSDLQPVFEAHAGVKLPADWPLHMQNQLLALAGTALKPVPGAAAALEAVTALGLPYRVASNSSRAEMAAKFAVTGLTGLVGDRIHSAADMGRGKPDPHVFLAAAAAEGVAPGECLVIEDSVPGVTAARAAGMGCVALTPPGDPLGLAARGARLIASLAELPALLRAALQDNAA